MTYTVYRRDDFGERAVAGKATERGAVALASSLHQISGGGYLVRNDIDGEVVTTIEPDTSHAARRR